MASVSKRPWKRPDGSIGEAWIVRWKDLTGSHRQKTFAKRKEADKFRAHVEVEVNSGNGVSVSASYSVKDLCDDFLKSSHQMTRDGKLAASTHKKEEFYFTRHIIPALGDIPLRDLTETQVDQWLHKLKAGRLRGSGDLMPATIKQLTQALGRALDMAVRRKMAAKNVAREVGKWREHRPGKNPAIRTFTVAQARQLLASVAHRDLGTTAKGLNRARDKWTRRSEAFTRCAIYLAAFCGLRLGEVLALRWEDFDFEGKVIRIRHSLDVFDTIKGPKTRAGLRDVPMPDILAVEIQAWRKHITKEERGLIFRTKSGGKITVASFHRHYWQRALDDAELGPDADGRRFHYHALRHFAASMMIAGGVPMPDVAKILGHASFDMTLQVYAHPVMAGNQQHAAIEAIANGLRTAVAQNAHALPHHIDLAA